MYLRTTSPNGESIRALILAYGYVDVKGFCRNFWAEISAVGFVKQGMEKWGFWVENESEIGE